jgi:hypothetical protein
VASEIVNVEQILRQLEQGATPGLRMAFSREARAATNSLFPEAAYSLIRSNGSREFLRNSIS